MDGVEILMPLGKDLDEELNSHILYNKVDHVANNEIVLTVKIDLPSVNDFKRLVGQGGEWYNTDKELEWLTSLIRNFDSNLDSSKPINLINKTYKDSIFNDKSVVVVIVRYKQVK